MFRLLPAFILASALLVSGCTTTQLTISPIPASAVGENPDVMVVEKTHRVSVELLTAKVSRKLYELPTFSINVENKGEDSILLSTGGIKLMSSGQPVPMYSVDEYAKLLQEANQWESDQHSARQAELALQTTRALRTAGIADNSEAMAKITSAKKTNNAAASREAATLIGKEIAALISIHQLNPGQSKQGFVKFHGEKIQADQALQLTVTIAGEPYVFDFEVTAQET